MIDYNKVPQATEEGPDIKISCISNIYVRMMNFKNAGIVELGHTHEHDHATMVVSGALEVQVYDDNMCELLPPVKYEAPSFIFIKKNTIHQLKSIEDNTIALCIHALRDIDDEIISPESIPVPLSLKDSIKYFESIDLEVKSPLNTIPKLEQHIGTKRFPREFNNESKI